MNIADTIDDARHAFEIAGRGCLVRMGGDEPRYATVRTLGPFGLLTPRGGVGWPLERPV